MHCSFRAKVPLVIRLLPIAVVLGLACLDSAKADEGTEKISGESLTILRDKENDAGGGAPPAATKHSPA